MNVLFALLGVLLVIILSFVFGGFWVGLIAILLAFSAIWGGSTKQPFDE